MSSTVNVAWGEWPPGLMADIVTTFRRLPRGVVFAYGDTIYVPGLKAGTIPEHLIVHERVHFRQQAAVGGPAAWWARYLADPAWRLEQELEAYREQLASLPDRAERRRVLKEVVKDLGGPMYGNLLTKEEARRLLSSRAAA